MLWRFEQWLVAEKGICARVVQALVGKRRGLLMVSSPRIDKVVVLEWCILSKGVGDDGALSDVAGNVAGTVLGVVCGFFCRGYSQSQSLRFVVALYGR